MSDDVDMQRLAKLTPGFVGADLANLVNKAALLSARREDKRVTMKAFEDGIERVIAGLEKTSRIIVGATLNDVWPAMNRDTLLLLPVCRTRTRPQNLHYSPGYGSTGLHAAVAGR